MEKIYVRPVHPLLDSIATRLGLNPIITFEIVAPDDRPNMCIWVSSDEEVENDGNEIMKEVLPNGEERTV